MSGKNDFHSKVTETQYEDMKRTILQPFSFNLSLRKQQSTEKSLSDLFAPVSMQSGVAPYIQIANRIREAIRNSLLQPNEKLPSESDLAKSFRVSRTTIRNALNILDEEGFIYKIHGVGTFIAELRPAGELNRLRGFYEEMTLAGYSVTSDILKAEKISADSEISDALRLEKGAPIYKFERLRFVDGKPIVFSYEHLPVSICPEFLDELKAGQVNSLYTYLERKGLRVRRAVLQFSATTAPPKICDLLRIPNHVPVLLEKRISMTMENKPINLSLSYFPGDRYTSIVELER